MSAQTDSRRHRWRRVAARVVLYGGAFFLGLPLAFSHVLTRTIRQPTEDPPPGYEEVWQTVDGLRLRSWLAPGERALPAMLLVHGLGDGVESYVAIGDVLRARGHSVLLQELRGHGKSEGSHTSFGGLERADVRAGMKLLGQRGLAREGIVLFGFSMGSVAVLRAAAEQPGVRAVVVESPFDDYRSTVAHHAWLIYRIPSWVPILPITIALAEWRAGFDADEVDGVAAAALVDAPLLAIVDGADPRMPEAIVRRVYDAHHGPKLLWVAPGASHVGAVLHEEYWPRVLRFLAEHGATGPLEEPGAGQPR
jgi:pimeloyl-ACP methyl ester carboxylesterase